MKRARKAAAKPAVTHKRIAFETPTFQALDLLGRDRMATFQELADEAFADLLEKHHRPTALAEALRESARPAEPARVKPAVQSRPRRKAAARRRA